MTVYNSLWDFLEVTERVTSLQALKPVSHLSFGGLELVCKPDTSSDSVKLPVAFLTAHTVLLLANEQLDLW